MAEKDLNELFLDTLKDIYYAEKQILKALPKMGKAAQSDKLRAAFEKHHDETEGQIERLEVIGTNGENFQSRKSFTKRNARLR